MTSDAIRPGAYPSAPAVSVVLPLYNAALYLDEAVKSVLEQSFVSFELIMVDDGSTDGSDKIAEDWARREPGRVKLLRHPGGANLGATNTRNLALEHARADLIAFIDADDVWTENKLEEQTAIFARHPEVGMVAGAALYWGSWSGGSDELVSAGHLLDRVVPGIHALLFVYPLGSAQAPCPSVLMVRREVVEKVGGFESQFTGPMQLYEDQAFLTKVYLETSVYFSSSCLLHYRQHAASCVSQVVGQGRYHQVRRTFLEWLESYLRRNKQMKPLIWLALAYAKLPYRAPLPARMLKGIGVHVPERVRHEFGRVLRRLVKS